MTSTTMTIAGDVVASVNDDDVNNTTTKDDDNENKINSSFVDHQEHQQEREQHKRGSSSWKHIVQWISSPILFGLLFVTGSAVRYPKSYIASIIMLSFGLFIGGISTNFHIESNEAMLWTPIGSQPATDAVWKDKHWDKNKQTKWNNPKVNNGDDEEEEEEDDNDIQSQDDETIETDVVVAEGSTRFITVIVHAQGENVITKEGLQYNFEMIDTVLNTPGFLDYCQEYGKSKLCPKGFEFICQANDISTTSKMCDIFGITAFWFQNSTLYDKQVETDQDVKERISLPIWPGTNNQFNIKHFIGFPRDENDTLIVGKESPTTTTTTTTGIATPTSMATSIESLGIESGISYTTLIVIEKGGSNSTQLERLVVERLLNLRTKWMTNSNNNLPYRVEVFATSSFPDEFVRGIGKDLKLIPMVFIIMSIFTWIIFSKRGGRRSRSGGKGDEEKGECNGEGGITGEDDGTTIIAESRGLLGFGAVICVALSIMSGYGLMFCCGVPFTVLTLIVPFVIFGVGLDDSYILMTAYDRTDRSKDPIERIHDTINYVGISIFLTTSTSVVAFVLGITSILPAIRWLCLYAAVTIWIDFIYQITFFLSMIVLDEQRLKANRRDCFVCWNRKTTTTMIKTLDDNDDSNIDEDPTTPLGAPGSDVDDDGALEESPTPPGPPGCSVDQDHENPTPPGPATSNDHGYEESPTPPGVASSDNHDEEKPPPPGPGNSNEGSHYGDHENHTPPCPCSSPPGPEPTTPIGAPGSDVDDDDNLEDSPTPPGPPGCSSRRAPPPEVVVKNFTEKFMTWYCEILFLPWVKPLVLAAFIALLVVCSINATKLELEFDFTSLLPDDTYVKPFNKAFAEMGTRPGVYPNVFFRDVDHSDPEIRAQMQDYIDALVELPHISDPPFNSWLTDYNEYSENNLDLLQGRSFNETIHMFLADPNYRRNKNRFRFDDQGIITASKIDIQLDALDVTSVDSILSFVRGQKGITSEQPINKDRKEFAFFNFDGIYFLWEFLYVTISELVQTTYLGIATVAVMGLLFMPHWSGIMFVFPLISILYIDLLGVFYMGGVSINGVSYIALVMSIGLLVDFILHFIHQYYESEKIGRTEKAKDVLCTVGVAILQGGISTFLGVLPLAFASNNVFHIIFVSFAGIVTLGVGHGLILLPVLMSYVGPE